MSEEETLAAEELLGVHEKGPTGSEKNLGNGTNGGAELILTWFPFPSGTTDDCNNHITCPSNAKCVNNTHCTCLDGYQPRGNRFFSDPMETCDDIDECLGLMVCGNFTECHNFPGSYYCSCRDGFESDPGKENFIPASENTCRAPSINCSSQFEGIKETCRNFSLPVNQSGGSSCFCSFFNSTLNILMSTCGDGNATLSLENATLRFNALLSSTSLWDGGDKGDVGSAVTVLLQSVELAALAIALQSPERTTQNVTTESLAIQTQLVTGNCSQHRKVFRLRAHNETMDVHCDTVTGAATQGVGAAAFISSSTLDSIMEATLPSEGNLPAGGKLEKSHLNSRVVSGAIGDGRPIHLSRPAHFTLRHRQAYSLYSGTAPRDVSRSFAK
ncbi:organic cation/carnitine transporter 7-like [Platysternon megacephalum]|uniref:Organic cation/carnitine transporter 7-like n=1 Tax=Platysternon megacephalum TaxID=55544 RepID=A0A4D9DGT6_9SAUR|nr:organic cation/carnitine transporter 7-like [Platysternon megacephalum]